MAVSVTTHDTFVIGDRKGVSATVTFDDSYNKGGEVITPEDFGLLTITHVFINKPETATYDAAWDRSASKIIAFVESDAGADDDGLEDEVANQADIDTVTVEVFVIGK